MKKRHYPHQELQVRIRLSTRPTPWKEGFERLLKYVEEHKAIPSQSYKESDGFRLGGWVSQQRGVHREGKIPPERKDCLEGVEGWTWMYTSEAAWEEGFAGLLKYVEEHGDTLVPGSYKEPDGYKLGSWVGYQRWLHKSRKILPERKARLESVEGWTWAKSIRDPVHWEESFTRLQKYVEEHGDVLIPESYKESDGFRLGGWVTSQRKEYKRGILSPKRKARLGGVEGWTWLYASETAWEKGFAWLLKYVEEHGDALVPASYEEPDGYKLGGWIGKQRRAHKKGKMPPDKKARLESVKGWVWDMGEAAWEESFARLLKYVEEHGDALVPRYYKEPDGYRLGSWMKHQRELQREGKILPERKARLGSVEGWVWKPRPAIEAAWEDGFVRLLKYVEEYKSIPKRNYQEPDGHRLGRWIDKQRGAHRRGKMLPEREARFGGIEGWAWDA